MSPWSQNGDAPTVMADGHDGLASQPTVDGLASQPTVDGLASQPTVPGFASQPTVPGPAGRGRHAREIAYSPAAVRAPQERDYRLRGLATEPTGQASPAPARMDHPRRRRRGPLLPGNSMTPTLLAGDRILVVKSGPFAGTIGSGQIVVLRPPQFLPCTLVGGRSGDLVLRVVALPGQTIWSVARTIFVNGQPLQDHGWYNPRYGQVGSAPIRSTTLGRNQYFVLADNRSDTCDSRVFGPISKSSIVGTGVAIVVRHGHFYLRKL